MARSQPACPRPQGLIRELSAADLPLFRNHLLRLGTMSRHDRFNGFTDDSFVTAYAARCFAGGATVLAFLDGGEIRGAAELHDCRTGSHEAAEIAFSVDDAFQGRGIGTMLFGRLIECARLLGCRTLHVTTHADNGAMKTLARRFGARLCFQSVDAVGVIDLGGGLPAEAAALVESLRQSGPAEVAHLSVERG